MRSSFSKQQQQQDIPEIRPEAMNGPILLGQELALRLVTSVNIPELRGEEQTAVSLDAARVHSEMVRLGRARPVIGNQYTGMVVFALARVELSRNRSSRSCGHNSRLLHDDARRLTMMEK
jgi:hypothetical protein